MALTSHEFTQKDHVIAEEKSPIVTAVFSNYTQFFEIKSEDINAETKSEHSVPSNCVLSREEVRVLGREEAHVLGREEAPSQVTTSSVVTPSCAGIKSKDLSVDHEPNDGTVQFAGQTSQKKSESCMAFDDVSLNKRHISLKYKPVSTCKRPVELIWKCPCGKIGRHVINLPLINYLPNTVSEAPETPPTIPSETPETPSSIPLEMTETPPTIPLEMIETPPTIQLEMTETPFTYPLKTTEAPPTIPMTTTEILPTISLGTSETPPTIPKETNKTSPTIPLETSETPPTIPMETSETVTPPTIPLEMTETPPTIPSETPETPPTIPLEMTETPPTIPSETPETPPTIPLETITEILNMETDQEVADTRSEGRVKTCSKKRPDRFCPYCKLIIKGGKLKRHIFRKHRNEPEVRLMNSKPCRVQNKFLDTKRREGIYEYNLQLIGDGLDPVMRERKSIQEVQLRVCTECKGFYSRKFFYKHKCVFKGDCLREAFKPKLLQEVTPDEMNSDRGFLRILNGFRGGEVGDFCRTDNTVKMIGYKRYIVLRHEERNKDEIRKTIMTDMRELSKLYFHFRSMSCKERTVEDMFKIKHLPDLIEALKRLVTKADKQEKKGQKGFLYAVVLRSVKGLESYYAQTMQSDKIKEFKNFKSAFRNLSRESYPSASLPSVQKVLQVKEYIAGEISSTLKSYSVENFAWLRSLVVARLTLFNARRGEEASRILLSEWEEAEKGARLPDNKVIKVTDHAEQYLSGKFMWAYLHGKGKKYVPILIPNDLLSAIQVIRSDRHKFGVREDNPFLFATENDPSSYCAGWHAVAEVCGKTDIRMSSETKMRHRLSSIYASLDMSPENQEIFLLLMRHEELQVDRENHQNPLGTYSEIMMGRSQSSVDEEHSSETDSMDGPSTQPEIADTSPAKTKDNSEHSSETDSMDGPSTGSEIADTSPPKTKGSSVRWSKEETKCIREHFKSYILERSEKNKGNLPSKTEIQEFLKTNTIKALEELDEKKQILKMRTKIFNERKTTRQRTTTDPRNR